MAYTLNGTGLGEIISEEHGQTSDMEQVSYPLSTSSECTVMDYGGVKRVITLRGRYQASTAEDLWNFIATIDALQNGAQTTVVYHSDGWDNSTTGNYQDGNFNVKVQAFRPVHMNDSVLSVAYVLVLFEGEAGF